MSDMPISDDYIIRYAEKTGYPPWRDTRTPVCPCCGAECTKVYKTDGEIVGCDVCLTESWAEEEDDCFRGGAYE